MSLLLVLCHSCWCYVIFVSVMSFFLVLCHSCWCYVIGIVIAIGIVIVIGIDIVIGVFDIVVVGVCHCCVCAWHAINMLFY